MLSLKELITRFVELGLRSVTPAGAPAPTRRRSAPPVARPATGELLPALSSPELDRLLEEDEVTGEPEVVPDWQRKILEARLAELEVNPDDWLTWDQVKAELAGDPAKNRG